jgi:uncharacterized 2Fe-2S/4Fe-4S cluster protein (DUF4445 family)
MVERKKSPGEAELRFEPDGLSVTVPKGTTVLDAAIECGVRIDSVCGGGGRCGRCKVRIKGQVGSIQGSKKTIVQADPQKPVLACMTTVEGDIDVSVPEVSRIGVHQILETSENVPIAELSPLVKKIHIKLPPPSLKDNLSDAERLRRGLKGEDKKASISLPLLKALPSALRSGGWEITVGIAETLNCPEVVSIDPGNTSKTAYGLAIDIGTTTVVVSLFNMANGEKLATESTYNQQIVFGEDVLSRITYAEEHGTQKLTKPIMDTIGGLIPRACASASAKSIHKIAPEDVIAAAISGNPTMIHFLLGLDPKHIRYEPYIPVVDTPHHFRASEVGIAINPHAAIYICPSRSSYVGGDVLADVVASGMHLAKGLTLLIDVGTNGEAVLGGKDWMVSCSCSAGPAFEGGEVASGMRAMSGAIDRIQIDPSGDVKFHTIGDVEPLGICGSGLIDLIAGLFIHEFIDRHGNLSRGKTKRIREREDGDLEFFVARRGRGGDVKGMGQEISGDITIKNSDIQNILRTKAAVYAGCSVLLKTMEHKFEDLSQVVIAGGFGHYLDIRKALMIGLFPDVGMERYRFIGNGALEGARLALLSKQKRVELQEIYENMTYLELSVNNMFFEEFTSALFIPHTEMSKFPSVKELIAIERRKGK